MLVPHFGALEVPLCLLKAVLVFARVCQGLVAQQSLDVLCSGGLFGEWGSLWS